MESPTWRVQTRREERPHAKARRLGFAAGLLARLSRMPRPTVTGADMRRHDYATSTQRLGVRFTERVRDMFRRRWMREIF